MTPVSPETKKWNKCSFHQTHSFWSFSSVKQWNTHNNEGLSILLKKTPKSIIFLLLNNEILVHVWKGVKRFIFGNYKKFHFDLKVLNKSYDDIFYTWVAKGKWLIFRLHQPRNWQQKSTSYCSDSETRHNNSNWFISTLLNTHFVQWFSPVIFTIAFNSNIRHTCLRKIWHKMQSLTHTQNIIMKQKQKTMRTREKETDWTHDFIIIRYFTIISHFIFLSHSFPII